MTYPTADEIRDIFYPLSQHGRSSEFFNHVSDTVSWTIQGTSPMSGHYDSKSAFIKATLNVLGDKVLTEPLRLKVVNVVSGGQSGSGEGVVEMVAIDAVCRNGMPYPMTYCWVLKFDENKKIVQVRAYIDTELLTRAMAQNQ